MDAILENKGKKWSREETILAFDLYCRTPFGKISKDNQDIILLASQLKRSPSSVALKMFNLAYYDPSLKVRNVTGMAHTSKMDNLIFNEFYQNLDELAYTVRIIKKNLCVLDSGLDFDGLPDEYDIVSKSEAAYKEQLVKIRLGQQTFRNAILNSYHSRCCITGIAIPELLIASHIKPWADCEERNERTNPKNGLCLNALHDKAFDKGFISITKQYKVIVSSRLKTEKIDFLSKEWISSYEGREIELPDKFRPSKDFIEYHNDVIFIP